MKKLSFIIIVLLVAGLLVPCLSFASAAKPEVNDTFYFGAVSLAIVSEGDQSVTGDGTVIHVRGFTSLFGMYYKSPIVDGYKTAPVNIGHIHMEGDFDFVISGTATTTYIDPISKEQKTVTYYVGEGTARGKWTMVFGENSQGVAVPSPFGVGTLEGVSICKVTSTFTTAAWYPSDAKGIIVATHGTGDFANAKLQSDFAFYPMISPSLGRIVRCTAGFDGSSMPVGYFPVDGIGNGILTIH